MRQKHSIPPIAPPSSGLLKQMNPLDQPGQEETFDDVMREISAVERKIVEEFGLTGPTPRLDIVSRLRSSTMPETEIVARWIGLYGALTRWLRENDSLAVPIAPPGPRKSAKAAESGLFFLPADVMESPCHEWLRSPHETSPTDSTKV